MGTIVGDTGQTVAARQKERSSRNPLAINLTGPWLISFRHFTLFTFCFQVELTVSPLPTLTESDQVLCTFGETTHYAQLKEGIIICDPPDIIPPTPKHQGKEILLPSTHNRRKEHSLLLLMRCSYMSCIQVFFFF